MASAKIKARVKVDTSGLKDIERTAKKKTITLKAVKAGGKVVQQAVKARAPRRKYSGALKQSIGVKGAKGTRGQTAAYAVIGPRKSVVKLIPPTRGKKQIRAVPAYYAHLVEKGTRPHRLGLGQRLARAATKKKAAQAATSQSRGGQHRGARANPFIATAWVSSRKRAAAVAQSVLGQEIKKELAKVSVKVRAKLAAGRAVAGGGLLPDL